ncbi:hypothetical protein HYW73_02645 [Candidatus Nomurabacteria bacterium]|nr:hypothetical protein [Candidatus Nomurabacteria bacterium]
MKFINKSWQKFIFLAYSILLPVISSAGEGEVPAPCDVVTSGKINNPLCGTAGSIPELIQKILEGALKIGIPLLALAVIYSGFLFVAARGNSEKLGKAKDTLLYTLIGGAILLGSWAIAELIANTVTSLG